MIKRILKIGREKNMLSLATNLVTAILGLVSFMLLTRGLEIKIFGDWVLFITLATFFDLLRFGLTSTALIRFASTDDVQVREAYLGSSYKIGLIAAVALAVILWLMYFIISITNIPLNEGYRLFLIWYPVLALLNLSWNNSISYFQALQKFKNILYIRLFTTGFFVLFLIFNNAFWRLGINGIMIAFIISNFLPSIFVFAKRWDGLMHIRKATAQTTSQMLHFGKYSMGTLIGSSLLRSADTIIIGLSPVLGSVGIALYAIPLKLTDILAIPLRSFSITAYPKMSNKSINGDIDGLKNTFYTYSGAVTLLFIPISVICYIFAEQLVYFLGGNDYINSLPLLVAIFRIFVLYTILLPIDRFTGVALDSINKPKFNFYKVILMASANVIGDLIAVFYFNSLEGVAVSTVLFTIIGIVAGYAYLNKFVPINIKYVFLEGIRFYKNIKQYI